MVGVVVFFMKKIGLGLRLGCKIAKKIGLVLGLGVVVNLNWGWGWGWRLLSMV